MIRYKLKELMLQKEREKKCRITLEEVAQKTGVHRSTLSRISNQKAPTLKINVINKLCKYFEVEISEVIEYVDDD